MVRLKQRYLLFEILSEDQYPSAKQILSVIRDQIADNFGDLGAGHTAASLSLKYYSSTVGIGILRVSRDHWRVAQAALTYTAKISKSDVILRVVKVSGTIRHAEYAAIELNRAALAQPPSSHPA